MKNIYTLFSRFLGLAFIFISSSISAQAVTVQTFTYTGATQTFVIPNACIGSMSVTLEGAPGFNAGWGTGLGGRVNLVFTPTPGLVMYLNVGGNGIGTVGGFNGGGKGGVGIITKGGAGGGASDIRIGGTTLAHRIAVAGGGGGSGGAGQSPANPGDGGGTAGNSCGISCKGGGAFSSGIGGCLGGTAPGYGASGAGGGFTSGGGPAGSGIGGLGEAGFFGKGGGGGDSVLSYGGTPDAWGHGGVHGGGGGGGGYYGGSGGMSGGYSTGIPANGGGGGGSSYADSTLFSSIVFVGFSFQGSVSFSYSINGPAITAVAATPSICSGGNVILNASGVSTYTWLPNVLFQGSNNSTVNVTPITTTNYTVLGTNSAGCVTQTIITLNVVPNATTVSISGPSSQTICPGQSVILTALNSVSSTWINSSNLATFYTNSIFVNPLVSTAYSVTGTNSSGCKSLARAVIIVDACTGLPKNDLPVRMISIYPNPGSGEFNVTTSQALTLHVFNQLGQEVLQQACYGTTTLSLKEFPNGVYFITGKTKDQQVTEKLILAR